MSRTIIGIHGLANKPSADLLEQWWHDAIVEGLAVNADRELSSLPFESVYWADVMYDQVDSNPDAYKPAQPGELKRYSESWLETLKDNITEGVGSAVDVFKQTFGIEKVAERVLDRKLSDLSRYYNEPQINSTLRNKLIAALQRNQDNRIMVVAHSMGSIIAYDVLRQLDIQNSDIKVEKFITIGSPLGLPHVKLKIADEFSSVETPACVDKWTNFADRLDPVALDPRLSDDYSANARGVKVIDDLVLNDWGGIRHKSYGYLRTPEFTDQVVNFI